MITTTIKSIQDIMRQDTGVDGDAQRLSQLGWMLLLKILDDREEEYEIDKPDYRSPIPEELRWRTWAADPEGITGGRNRPHIRPCFWRAPRDPYN
jgi:type I restriction enzyme M protein